MIRKEKGENGKAHKDECEVMKDRKGRKIGLLSHKK